MEDRKYKNEVRIVFDQDSRDRYNKWYLKYNPRAKKPPITDNIPPLLNAFTSKTRMVQNGLKQKWKEYTIWRLKDMELQPLNVEKCRAEFHTILPTKRRADLDGLGIASKFINDGITVSGLIWEDDCYTILEHLGYTAEYQKDVRELHIIIRY